MLERRFWTSLGTEALSPPVYGADVVGSSLFEDMAGEWNLKELKTMLQGRVQALPGVTSSSLYVGMWRTTFAWHTEDYELGAINFNHMGARKQWYAIPRSARARFQALCDELFPREKNKCEAYMRHKTFMIAPSRLREVGIPVFYCIQEPGEFVITLPGAFHCGFNHGFNIAEACNYAVPSWIPLGLQVRFFSPSFFPRLPSIASTNCLLAGNSLHLPPRNRRD